MTKLNHNDGLHGECEAEAGVSIPSSGLQNSDTLTLTDLEAIEARCNAATPGPWALETVPTQVGICHKIGPFPSLGFHHKTFACVYADSASLGHYVGIPGELHANAELIANARTDLPRLCAALKQRMADSQWRSIDSAPKDGRTLLLGYFNQSGKWRTTRGQWFTKEQIDDEWDNGENFDADWYETSVENDEPPNCWLIAPSYWMPLPSSPVVEADEQGEGEG